MTRPATDDELDAVKKDLQTLQHRVDQILTGLNAALRSAHDYDQRLRRMERLDTAKLERLENIDFASITSVIAEAAHTREKVAKIEQAVAVLQRSAGRR